jgi:hypothetical protein
MRFYYALNNTKEEGEDKKFCTTLYQKDIFLLYTNEDSNLSNHFSVDSEKYEVYSFAMN